MEIVAGGLIKQYSRRMKSDIKRDLYHLKGYDTFIVGAAV